MEENNFEKQVQQKMDELKIPPSEIVWQKIEMRIEKRKPRRRILFFILPLIFIMLGGYWVYNTYHSASEGSARNKNILAEDGKEGDEKNVDKPTSKNLNSNNIALTKQKVNKDFTESQIAKLNSSKTHSSKFINNNKLTSKIVAGENENVNINEEKNEKKVNVEKDNNQAQPEKFDQIAQTQNVAARKKDSSQNSEVNVPFKKSLQKNNK